MSKEEYNEDCEVCELCGNDHESRDCELEFCDTCLEELDNCDCEEHGTLSAEEYLDRKYKRNPWPLEGFRKTIKF